MAYDAEVSLDITSYLGMFHAGFWLFIAAPVSQFAVFAFRHPPRVQQWDEKVSSWVSSKS